MLALVSTSYAVEVINTFLICCHEIDSTSITLHHYFNTKSTIKYDWHARIFWEGNLEVSRFCYDIEVVEITKLDVDYVVYAVF